MSVLQFADDTDSPFTMSSTVRKLTTDYLIVGAGAQGMSFLEELITGSKDIEAIIVDNRSAPGGHWNDAYSFVRLHAPALTYGVNSRTLGDGGSDLASKVLILQHYELAMKDLVATGRVKFFPQCKYMGDGRFVSLLDESLKYEVEIKAKFVDASYTTNHVPATTKPNYVVSEEVNLIPINGLSDISKPWPHYLVIGGGKTGIDSILHLLDHGVNPDKMSWVVPNDSWFFSRFHFVCDEGTMTEAVSVMMDAITDEKADTREKALLNLEDAGCILRLDKNILPTRFRGATITQAEIEKIGQIKNIIRKGRIECIEPGKVIFKSGEELQMDPNTLHVDCSTNSTLLPPVKKVFDGKTIALQMIMLPPPGMSACVIAALELNFQEDEERKNFVCKPINQIQMPKDLFSIFHANEINNEAATKALGKKFQKNRRAFAFHHIQFFDMIKLIYTMMMKKRCLC